MSPASIPAPADFAPAPAHAPAPAAPDVQVVIRTPALAEVRIVLDGDQPSTIGTVRLTRDSWCWEHNDGEQSSPISTNRLAAARALAEYHRAYKPRRARASMRQLLDAARVR
jgi:hypothetical protein